MNIDLIRAMEMKSLKACMWLYTMGKGEMPGTRQRKRRKLERQMRGGGK